MSNWIDPVSALVLLDDKIRHIETTEYDYIHELKSDVAYALDSVRDVLRDLIEAHNDSRD
jgi:hypothetical protein